RAHGIDLPRDSGDQAKAGKAVSSSNLKAGDLLFFSTPSGTVHHVGMYVGDGKMIHSPNASKDVYVTDWKKWDTGNEFSGARRILCPVGGVCSAIRQAGARFAGTGLLLVSPGTGQSSETGVPSARAGAGRARAQAALGRRHPPSAQ